jgi:hypothetical protein
MPPLAAGGQRWQGGCPQRSPRCLRVASDGQVGAPKCPRCLRVANDGKVRAPRCPR